MSFLAESVFNILRSNRSDRRADFLSVVRKGDILVSRSSFVSGLVGHAAIMATDQWVIEMPGGGGGGSSSGSLSSSSSSTDQTLEDNNRRISKQSWFDEHASDSITVYRCPDYAVACMAADWAYTHYYNASGGDRKTIHIRYSLVSPDFSATDPSYCSKLVLQAYFFGTGSRGVISIGLITLGVTTAIVPTAIPAYFTSPYALEVVARF